jgi:hypothetical protein
MAAGVAWKRSQPSRNWPAEPFNSEYVVHGAGLQSDVLELALEWQSFFLPAMVLCSTQQLQCRQWRQGTCSNLTADHFVAL